MNTLEIFRRWNFHLLNQIMEKDFGIIECGSITDPREEVFNQKIEPPCVNKKIEC
ncbi:hypothetical protein [Flavobacterium sp. UMI-01]|uniref:hypothetical protein n=1 Tax=Flavobacterium sp. UMI-01 TaxID=1441053 RepID=UPI001C7D0038|nr:hypothetical protein [Flavobacterium sp. UMI-01]